MATARVAPTHYINYINYDSLGLAFFISIQAKQITMNTTAAFSAVLSRD
jgi:hypothetical protein